MKRYVPSAEVMPFLRALIYGAPGTGKTTFVNTFDRDERSARVLHLDCGGNPVTLRFVNPEPIVVRIDLASDINLIYDFLYRGQPADHRLRKELGLGDEKFQTVVLDTITEYQNLMIAEIAGVMGTQLSDLITLGKIQDWGMLQARTLQLVRVFYKLPMHVIFVAQERLDTDESTGTSGILPFLRGAAVSLAPSYAELVGRIVKRGIINDRVSPPTMSHHSVLLLETVGPSMGLTKNQVDQRLGREIIDPTATKIFDAITKKEGGKQ